MASDLLSESNYSHFATERAADRWPVESRPLPPKFWRISKYLFPLSQHIVAFRGEKAPRNLATLDEMTISFPQCVSRFDLGIEPTWEAFQHPVVRAGRIESLEISAEDAYLLRVFALTNSTSYGRSSSLIGPDQTLAAELGYYLAENDPKCLRPFSRINPKFYLTRWLVDLRYRRHLPEAVVLPGTAVLLNNPWCHNYYHWLLEVAPRLTMMRQANQTADWYVVDSHSRFQRRVLELLGVPADRIIQPHCALHLRADQFLRPSHPGTQAWRDTAQAILSGIETTECTSTLCNSTVAAVPSKRIYISRRMAAHRKVANESELESFLQRHGFQAYCFEQLDFAQQAALIQQAEIIVAVHGAALANLIFARPGTKVVEICPVNRYNIDCFPRISHKMQLEHISILAQSTRYRQSLTVHLDEVGLALRSLKVCS